MGVMECSRVGCRNVMCNRYSPVYGYICNYCFADLLKRPFVSIENFMDQEDHSEKNNEWEETLTHLFRQK